MDITYHTRAIIDEKKCNRCGKCVISCRDGGFQAISFSSNDILPRIDLEKCVGCSLCAHVCPHDAISLEETMI